jgi:ATP-dependent DNA helicase RecQ
MRTADEGEVNNDLFSELKKLRYSISREENVPAYIIFNDKSLKAMASEFPVTENAFLAVSGVGSSKMEKYGDKFIAAIKGFKTATKLKAAR